MKGIVFTEFMDMVETKFGSDTLENVIDGAKLANGGAYTSVGTYDHRELVAMVAQLSSKTGIAAPDLIKAFGEHLFSRFVVGYPRFFTGVSCAFDFLASIDGHIHVEVRKLYPDAELPKFDFKRVEPDRAEMIYRSSRHFADLAHGLIAACAAHFKERIEIRREDMATASGSAVRFFLTRTGSIAA